jgi:hypothetical protein
VIFPPLSFCSWILVPAHELDAQIILPHPSFLLHFDSVSYCPSLVYSLRVLVLAQSVRTCFQRRCPDLSPAEAADFARLRGSILRCHHCHAAAGAQCSLSSIRFGLRSGILLPFWLCPLESVHRRTALRCRVISIPLLDLPLSQFVRKSVFFVADSNA